jgi:hypothetical protein
MLPWLLRLLRQFLFQGLQLHLCRNLLPLLCSHLQLPVLLRPLLHQLLLRGLQLHLRRYNPLLASCSQLQLPVPLQRLLHLFFLQHLQVHLRWHNLLSVLLSL